MTDPVTDLRASGRSLAGAQPEPINLDELRQAAMEREPDEPEGHVCMTGDYVLALLDAVEAAQRVDMPLWALHLGYCPHSTPEDEANGAAILRLDLALARFAPAGKERS